MRTDSDRAADREGHAQAGGELAYTRDREWDGSKGSERVRLKIRVNWKRVAWTAAGTVGIAAAIATTVYLLLP